MAGSARTYGVILAGGSGTRLWPLSRRELPKQFLAIDGKNSLLQNTILRLAAALPRENIRIVAGREWRDLVLHQAAMAGASGNLLIEESEGRNTAPAIALSIAALLDEGASPDDIVLVAPSDHSIKDAAKFREAAKIAMLEAESGNLATFGIVPDKPETGFGYIKAGEATGRGAFRVERFVEKPDKQTAQAFLEEGGYYWNGGIFCFRIGDMSDALARYFPECGSLIKLGAAGLAEAFASIPSRSIDIAVMERADNIACVPMDAGWSDVGSWDAVWESLKKDENGNAVIGDAIASNAENCLIMARSRLVCAADVKDIIAIDTPDALFITSRGKAQAVRMVVDELRGLNRKEERRAAENARPWGTYKILSQTDTDKIKRIRVEPRKRLSLQYHRLRSEHWIVVSGLATVTLISADDRRKKSVLTLSGGESCFVPAKTLHRLENCTDEPLEIIEVQTGSYLGEDDIVRVDDDFQRA